MQHSVTIFPGRRTFERRRSDYYDRLQAVRERGELREWLGFFLAGVTEQATDAVTRAERLVDLREVCRQRLARDRSRAVEVIDLVFQNPVITTSRVAGALGTSLQGALNHVRRLEAEEILTEVTGIPGRSKRWVAMEALNVLEPDVRATSFGRSTHEHAPLAAIGNVMV